MVAQTRAQAKYAAAAAGTSSHSASSRGIPIAKHTRKRALPTRAQRSGKQTQGACGPRRSTRRRKASVLPVAPIFPDNDSSIEPNPTHQSSNRQLVSTSSAISSIVGDDTVTGWKQSGNCLRRESFVSPELTTRIQTQQQVALAEREGEVYREQTMEMMSKHSLTYQWYDRMMVEGLRNRQEFNTNTVGLDAVMEDRREGELDDGDEDPDMENDDADADAMALDSANNSVVASFPDTLFQPCPPGVRYALVSTPTEILYPCD
ncbi:hypothetical protein BDP27DRAFT_1321423 [Rhodocollybia butyracea]|uniref:Uncharacterized protein n=1 Tax=Rhodocollybia butyracea TaxID=206335 RepID=A0A9P5PYM9_9AGAR|nr:hypothetical protein BDP27DRAFT_1321423 [Rhodocollybia butyracea]